jgi:hydrogenase maturation factor HypF (carbamoyltransferase family)
LFEYLIKNISKDKKRLSATVQLYLAKGLYQIASKYKKPIVFSGGCAYNRIMTGFFTEQEVKINTKVPSGDGGVSFGQAAFYLYNQEKYKSC